VTDAPVVVVTDNKGYCNFMVEAFQKLVEKKMFKSKFGSDMFSNELPSDYGSSYFDRFWKNGNYTSRFYLHFTKI
jgi:hypothetical protein